MKNALKIQAVVDRFEDDNAILLIGEDDQQAIFPVASLPEGLSEGDYIRMEISYDVKATKAAMEEAARLLDELRGSRS